MSFVVNNTTIKDKIQIVETESTKETKEFKCHNCKGEVQILAKAEVTLKDMPDYPETVKLIKCHIHRYRYYNIAYYSIGLFQIINYIF